MRNDLVSEDGRPLGRVMMRKMVTHGGEGGGVKMCKLVAHDGEGDCM